VRRAAFARRRRAGYPPCMRRLALLVAASACIASFAGEAPPDIPDPFGLGERLALIDHLRDALQVAVPDDATYEQLVALYWASRRDAAPSAEEALTRDRVQRLRGQLADEFGIQAEADAGEDALVARLALAREGRVAAALAAPTRIAQSEVDNIRARVQRLGADARAERDKRDELDGRRRELFTDYEKARERLAQLAQAGDADAYDALVETINGMARRDQELQAAMTTAARRAEQLEGERNETEIRLAMLAAEAGAGDPGDPDAPLADRGALPRPEGLEAQLKAAVVLVMVEERGSGTGFFISGDGLVVTNAHVLGDKRSAIGLWDAAAKRTPVRLRVVQIDDKADLCLLRAEGGPFNVLPMTEVYELSKAMVSAGFPLAGQMATNLGTSPSDIVVSRGSITSLRRRDDQVEWIQHDCGIASGSSGGPLVDPASGAVAGVNCMVMEPSASGGAGASMSLAIPVRKVREIFAAHLE